AVVGGGDDRPGVGEQVTDGEAWKPRDGPELERSVPLEELWVTDSANRIADRRHDLARERASVGQRIEAKDADARRSGFCLAGAPSTEGEEHLLRGKQVELHVLRVLVAVLVDDRDVPDDSARVGRTLGRGNGDRRERAGRGGGRRLRAAHRQW